jgi:hypothetical protein
VIRGTRSGRHVGSARPDRGSRGPRAAPAAAALAAALASSPLLHRVAVRRRRRGGQTDRRSVGRGRQYSGARCRPSVCLVLSGRGARTQLPTRLPFQIFATRLQTNRPVHTRRDKQLISTRIVVLTAGLGQDRPRWSKISRPTPTLSCSELLRIQSSPVPARVARACARFSARAPHSQHSSPPVLRDNGCDQACHRRTVSSFTRASSCTPRTQTVGTSVQSQMP